MDDQLSQRIRGQIDRLWKGIPTLRVGEVSALSPLTVKLGGSTTAYSSGVKAIGVVEVGDIVGAFQQGQRPPVIFKLSDGQLPTTTDVTYGSGWADNDATHEGSRYWKDRGIVRLEGLAKRTGAYTFNGSGATIFTLPAGYRPEKKLAFAQIANDPSPGGAGRNYVAWVYVNPDGTVVVAAAAGSIDGGGAPTAATNTFVSLSGISFRAA